MAIPDYQTLMLPLLKFLKDRKEHSLQDAINFLGDYFKLSEDELREMLPSGQQEVFRNRVGWARTYLKKSCLLDSTKRGYFKISERGLNILGQNLDKIDVKYLSRFPEFLEFKDHSRRKPRKKEKNINHLANTPEELLESAYQNLKNSLANDILERIKSNPPNLFEKIVVELLVEMGYGGSRRDAGKAFRKSRDEGIDGIIKEDRLGLDIIYIQAKRWENTVGRPEIQKFAGALQGKRARKGVFLTTSDFSKDALDYVQNIELKIILIDGKQLAEYMIENNVGVTPVSIYEIKKIDGDYFIEE